MKKWNKKELKLSPSCFQSEFSRSFFHIFTYSRSKKVTQDIMQVYMKSLDSGIVFVSHEQVGYVYYIFLETGFKYVSDLSIRRRFLEDDTNGIWRWDWNLFRVII